MSKHLTIDTHIEELRLAMYEAYSKDPDGAEVLRISKQLDELINIALKNP
ncbi:MULTISPECIES: aspartyl-phosphate phosphatase Spo0E family protein [Paraliobacillus]|nr:MULTISPECIES: aspartyl-phosphate phosphatase Spo0E family protein [Paraliobacillus]